LRVPFLAALRDGNDLLAVCGCWSRLLFLFWSQPRQ